MCISSFFIFLSQKRNWDPQISTLSLTSKQEVLSCHHVNETVVVVVVVVILHGGLLELQPLKPIIHPNFPDSAKSQNEKTPYSA